MNKKIVHDALILTAFTLVLGFVLGLVYDITKNQLRQQMRKLHRLRIRKFLQTPIVLRHMNLLIKKLLRL